MHILGIRSRTQLTRGRRRPHADRLIAVGCFSVGTNQVDLDAARVRGIPVFNAPFSNTRSVAELVIGEIVMLLRRIFPRSVAAQHGGWDKSAKRQPRGARQDAGHRRLRQHRQPAVRRWPRRWACGSSSSTSPTSCATATPSRWRAWTSCCAMSDVVSLHVPETPATAGMIGEPQIARDEAGRLPHQQQPRHRGRPRRAGRRAARGPPARRRGRRVSRGAHRPTARSSARRCRASTTSS